MQVEIVKLNKFLEVDPGPLQVIVNYFKMFEKRSCIYLTNCLQLKYVQFFLFYKKHNCMLLKLICDWTILLSKKWAVVGKI